MKDEEVFKKIDKDTDMLADFLRSSNLNWIDGSLAMINLFSQHAAINLDQEEFDDCLNLMRSIYQDVRK